MSWTDERVDLLGKLWLEGRSASQIAGELGMGVTRNAVIGKVHRLGLAGRPKATVPVMTAPPRGKPKPAPRQNGDEAASVALFESMTPPQVPLKPYVQVTAQSRSDVVIPFSERVTIMDLRESSCRWPMGDPSNAEFRFCGARTGAVGSPYCLAHSRLAFQPAPERRRDRVDRYARIAS